LKNTGFGDAPPGTAGFVLAGGKSTRMGKNKALLRVEGIPLIARIASAVAAAAGSATLVGRPESYSELNLPAIPDSHPGLGPLGGIATALGASTAEWNLIVACDMPGLEAGPLRSLLAHASAGQADCVLAAGPSGLPEPLCGVYNRRCLPEIDRALERGVRKIMDALAPLHVEIWRSGDERSFLNVNTRDEWEGYLNRGKP
jgi:molybdenum cofactor guanylyltransferase